MFRNILAAILRSAARNGLFGLINIGGLAVGFAAAILIGLYVRHEFSYDRWFPGHEHVFTPSVTVRFPVGAQSRSVDASRPALAAALKANYPGIEAVTRIWNEGFVLRRGEVEAGEDIDWVDPDFFKVLPLPLIAGDSETALAQPNSIVLTRTIAMKYFGRPDPLGETVEVGDGSGSGWHSMRVTGIIEDLPTNTHLVIEILGSSQTAFSRLAIDDRTGSTAESGHIYFRLRPGVSPEGLSKLEPTLIRTIYQNIEAQGAALGLDPDDVIDFHFTPIADVHLRPAGLASMSPSADRGVLQAMVVVGLLIVVLAGINFANLAAAQANQRSMEVGIRKTAGARRRDLMVHFLAESLFCVVVAMALALALVEIALPLFRAETNANVVFAYWRDAPLAGGILAAIVLVGIGAGLYPAFILAAFRVISTVKGAAHRHAARGLVRSALVVLQFAVLIGIAVATLTIYRQTQFALNEALKVNMDQVLIVNSRCSQPLTDEIAELPGVRAASCTSQTILGGSSMDSTVVLPSGDVTSSRHSQVDFGLFELYGLTPLAGRFFDQTYQTDAITDSEGAYHPPIVVNETALRRLALGTPDEAIGKTVTWARVLPGVSFGRDTDPRPSAVIGVVEDFSFHVLRDRIEPQIYYIDPAFLSALNVKLDGARVPEALAAIDARWRARGERVPTRLFLDELMQRRYLNVTRQGATFGTFAGLAMFISCIGLLGLSASTAARRTKEIGIRKSMGASSANILRLLTWEFAKPVLLANLIAWPIAWWAMQRWLQGFAYRIELAPDLFMAAGAIALVIALATVSIHAWLVARAKPVTALRYE